MTVAAALRTDRHVNPAGAAAMLGITRYRVLSLSARGLLPPVTVGGRVFFERAQVEALREQIAAERERRG